MGYSMGIKGVVGYITFIMILCVCLLFVKSSYWIEASQDTKEESLENKLSEEGNIYNQKIQLNEGEVVRLDIPNYEEQKGVSWNWHIEGEEQMKILEFFPENGYAKVQGKKEGDAILEAVLCNQDGQIIVSLVWNISILRASVSNVKQPIKQPLKQEDSETGQLTAQKDKTFALVKTKKIQSEILKITQKKSALYIQIKPCSEAKYYQVYRSINKKRGYKKIGTVKKTIYKDDGVKGEKTYYYKVKVILKDKYNKDKDSKNLYNKHYYTSVESKSKRKKVKSYLSEPQIKATLTWEQLKISGGKVPVGTGVEVYVKEKGRAYTKAASHYYTKKNQRIMFKISRNQFQSRSTCYIKIRIFQKVNKEKIYSKFSNIISI